MKLHFFVLPHQISSTSIILTRFFVPFIFYLSLLSSVTFLSVMVCLTHNLKCETFNVFCNVFINIICFMYTMKCLYPYHTVLLFQHILVLHNCVKTYSFLIFLGSSINSPKDTGFFMSVWDFFNFKPTNLLL